MDFDNVESFFGGHSVVYSFMAGCQKVNIKLVTVF